MLPEIIESKSKDAILSFESQFNPFEKQAEEWMNIAKSIQVSGVSDIEAMKKAREARLALRGIRINIEKKHKELKEEYLRTGQAVDAIKKRLTGLIEPIEAVLLEQEKFEETQTKLMKEKLYKDRISILLPIMGESASKFPLADMDEEVFQSLVEGQKLAAQQKIENERILREANEKAERDRKEESARLKRYTVRYRQLAQYGLKAIDSDSIGITDVKNGEVFSILNNDIEHDTDEQFDLVIKDVISIHKSNEEIAAMEKEKAEKERLKQEEKLKKERAERKRLEDEASAREAAELAEKKKKAAEERKKKNAPDVDKIRAAAAQIAAIQFLPVGSEEAQKIVDNAKILLGKVVTYINEKTEGL